MNQTMRIVTTLAVALLVATAPAFAAARAVRCVSRTSVTRSSVAHHNVARSNVAHHNVVRSSTSVHRNTNVHIDRDIDIDVHHGHVYHPVAAVGVTTVVVGAILYTPPPTYTVVVVDGVTYYFCENIWYQPRFSGTTTTYVVVNAPR